MNDAAKAKARAMLRDPEISVAAVAEVLGVSRSTLYLHLPEARKRSKKDA